MKKAHYDEGGRIVGFYDPAIHADIPAPVVDIPDDAWAGHTGGTQVYHVDLSGAAPAVAPYIPPPPSREDQRRSALAKIDAEHARYLRALTGGATIEERDTWKPKEEASRAFEAGTATPGQAAMLAAEADGGGITEAELAAKIIAKADAFLALIGVAAGLRAKARAAIMAATDEAVPLDQVSGQITAAFTQLDADAKAAVAQFTNETQDPSS
ncbi:hypothetical protein [Paracoccus jiaweipingae]|uniref:hypothetical protein n=1 Tax=unclassified Paracoccus (in: a-proteobacteria) TaxID=2688777 RepID=UPI0037B32D3B